jgi:uncharacterized iron-regulated membrane protein
MKVLIRIIHRYVGLTLALFLFIAALSGIVLSFNHELERVISPELFIVKVEKNNQQKLDPLIPPCVRIVVASINFINKQGAVS